MSINSLTSYEMTPTPTWLGKLLADDLCKVYADSDISCSNY